MRLHIEIDDAVVYEIDAAAGPRGRTKFIREAISIALRHREQRELIQSARGSIEDRGHEWESDPAAWVRNQRASRRT
ncbi:MAG TPA: hypothetical protein VM784_10265 [Actinomycetota bacterium]|nr:hypothetical protein [Actinomycetota bacterium]